MLMRARRELILLLAFLSVSCATSPRPGSEFAVLFESGTAYTLVNLHPNEIRKKLYAVNYLQGGLIPLCSRVELLKWKGDRMEFRVSSTGRDYLYDYHDAAVVSFEDHLSKYFGESCDESRVAALGALDQKGIRAGRLLIGMTKEGTILAIGYPPPHQTPTLEADEWRYWKGRFDTIAVIFGDDGRVKKIKE